MSVIFCHYFRFTVYYQHMSVRVADAHFLLPMILGLSLGYGVTSVGRVMPFMESQMVEQDYL